MIQQFEKVSLETNLGESPVPSRRPLIFIPA